eukprot:3074773-Amphidinium_carterae.1
MLEAVQSRIGNCWLHVHEADGSSRSGSYGQQGLAVSIGVADLRSVQIMASASSGNAPTVTCYSDTASESTAQFSPCHFKFWGKIEADPRPSVPEVDAGSIAAVRATRGVEVVPESGDGMNGV